MRRDHAVRGAALPETALVLTMMLALVFGIIQIGVIGYLQIVVDGAAFIAAHEYAIGNTSVSGSTSYVTYAQAFPIASSSPSIQTLLPDQTTVPVNYNTNLTTQRHGGVSLVLSGHLQASVQQNAPSGLLGVGVASLSNLAVQGAAIEPQFGVSNTVYDAEGGGYSTPSALSSYADNAQNAPANYISQHLMSTCNVSGKNVFGPVCPTADTVLRSLGTAEFLDQDNWQRTNLGVGLYPNYTFGEMLFHQNVFAQFAALLPPGALPDMTTPSATALMSEINAWDVVTSTGGYPGTETSYGLYPLHPALGAP